jgi:hypothetical protein
MMAQMTAHARRIEREFKREMSRLHRLVTSADVTRARRCRPTMPARASAPSLWSKTTNPSELPYRTFCTAPVLISERPQRSATRHDDSPAYPLSTSYSATSVFPDGSGFELARWCPEVRPHMRILLTSGWYRRPTAGGEFLVLLKPHIFVTLLALLKQLSSRRDARPRPIEVK